MNGKSKCKILKEIRKKIAEENNIAYVTSECKYQGNCTGTCPKCEAEVRYLEEQLTGLKNAGKAVAVAGIAAALMVTASACHIADAPDPTVQSEPTESGYEDILDGNMELPDQWIPQDTEPELMGEETEAQLVAGEIELMGDFSYYGE